MIPNAPKTDHIYLHVVPKDFEIAPYANEEAAKFDAADRSCDSNARNSGPRSKSAGVRSSNRSYPSHSDDDEPPDT